MEDLTLAILLQLIGMGFLIVEIFIPSHGVLTVAGVGCLAGGVYMGFSHGRGAGYVCLVIDLVTLPVGVALAIKYWHRTPIGRRISPPNRRLDAEDRATRSSELEALVGTTGRSLTLLRPIGTCEFGRRRVECVAETGMIAPGRPVKGVGVRNMSLVVCDVGEPTNA